MTHRVGWKLLDDKHDCTDVQPLRDAADYVWCHLEGSAKKDIGAARWRRGDMLGPYWPSFVMPLASVPTHHSCCVCFFV